MFRLPDEILLPVGPLRYGDHRPSELLDPGEWVEVSDARARQGDLPVAIAALEEALKFIPAGELAQLRWA